ncbi:hypothetical protein CORC01_10390 [Colletotrichum orchidophilum]|uniref:Uncharacterized protein n=1 Tax=Colletotrichum orchidophilum TaxID=1209926 RepID=A0A1G4AZ37_9PEZI|nr:uncharacterized protein CORC01_10390 [Colletotrichum orchidophilum]OHE94343.1 hypothetical protein CORC01_10390 [Colletotrichum orchidophilum]
MARITIISGLAILIKILAAAKMPPMGLYTAIAKAKMGTLGFQDRPADRVPREQTGQRHDPADSAINRQEYGNRKGKKKGAMVAAVNSGCLLGTRHDDDGTFTLWGSGDPRPPHMDFFLYCGQRRCRKNSGAMSGSGKRSEKRGAETIGCFTERRRPAVNIGSFSGNSGAYHHPSAAAAEHRSATHPSARPCLNAAVTCCVAEDPSRSNGDATPAVSLIGCVPSRPRLSCRDGVVGALAAAICSVGAMRTRPLG